MKLIREKHFVVLLIVIFLFGCEIMSGCIDDNKISDSLLKERQVQVSPAFTTVSPVITSSPQKSDVLSNETSQKLPDFMPGINDKMSYEEEKRLIKNSTQSQPVPESDIANIILSKTWFMQNDKDPRPDEVLLTFPAKWVDSPAVNDNEEIVLLRVPKKMLELDDSNPDPEMITVSYPEMKFKEFTNRNAINLTSHT